MDCRSCDWITECSREASPYDLDEDSASTSPPPASEPPPLPPALASVASSSSRSAVASRCEETESASCKVTVATQTGQETPDLSFNADKMTFDENCYECKVKYRDPKPKDLVMYLHAWKYRVSTSASMYIPAPTISTSTSDQRALTDPVAASYTAATRCHPLNRKTLLSYS